MKNNKSLVVGALVMALLVVSIAYAAIATVSLFVTGTTSAKSNQAHFKVTFTGRPSVDDSKTVGTGIIASAAIDATDTTKATMSVSEMTEKDNSVTFKFPIKNESTDLSADLSALVETNTNQEYFKVDTSLEDATIAANGATNLIVKVTLKKTPLNAVSGDLKIGLAAVPVQPRG